MLALHASGCMSHQQPQQQQAEELLQLRSGSGVAVLCVHAYVCRTICLLHAMLSMC